MIPIFFRDEQTHKHQTLHRFDAFLWVSNIKPIEKENGQAETVTV